MKVTADELKAARAAGAEITLIDVRTPAEFSSIHIPGSRLHPLDGLNEAAVSNVVGEAERTVLICKSGSRAAKAARIFEGSGVTGIAVLEGGIDAWAAAGHPVIRGQGGIFLERQVRVAAGLLVVVGTLLGFSVHPAFHGISAFVGAGLMLAGITDWCGMALLLAKMPWNSRHSATATNVTSS